MDLTQDFEKAKAAYDSHLAFVTQHRRKETWSAGHYFNIDPLDFQRAGLQQGTLLKKKPSSTKQKYCYVFGEDEVLLQVCQGLSLPNQFNEEFLFVEDGYSKSCLYGNNKSLINVKTKVFIDSRLKEVFLLGKLGSKHEQYFYENGILTHIEVNQWSGGQQGASYTTFITYVEGLATEIINRFDNGYSEVRYVAKNA